MRIPLAIFAALFAISGYAQEIPQARMSAAVAFARESVGIRDFLGSPGIGYVQADVRFGAALDDDVIMFVDQELLEGLTDAKWVHGGDWMALVGIQRSGTIRVAGGWDLDSLPSMQRNWQIFELGQRLKPDTWYRLRVEADFRKREFRTFSIAGGGMHKTIALQESSGKRILLDYPNYMPFDRGDMIYVVGAIRSRTFMKPGQADTPALVYFDNVEGGRVLKGNDIAFFQSDFEKQAKPAVQPSGPLLLSGFRKEHWYLEREEALFEIKTLPAINPGTHLGIANVRLEGK